MKISVLISNEISMIDTFKILTTNFGLEDAGVNTLLVRRYPWFEGKGRKKTCGLWKGGNSPKRFSKKETGSVSAL